MHQGMRLPFIELSPRPIIKLTFRLSGFFAALVVLVPPQLLLMHVPRWRYVLPRLFFKIMLKLLAVRVELTGALPDMSARRGTLLVANHVSWFDIALIGAALPTGFIAKNEVKGWPLFGQLARLNNTLFVTRRIGQHVKKEGDALAHRLARGETMVLFAEGTSSDGFRVLPFKSTLLSAVEGPLGERGEISLQAMTLAYTRLHNIAMSRRQRMAYGWIGDMSFVPHFLFVFAGPPLTVDIVFHPPLEDLPAHNRKTLARRLHGQVSQGLEGLMRATPHPVAADTSDA